MLGLGPIGTLKGIKPTGGDAKKPSVGKKPATSNLDFDFSDDDEPGTPCPYGPGTRARTTARPQLHHSTHPDLDNDGGRQTDQKEGRRQDQGQEEGR